MLCHVCCLGEKKIERETDEWYSDFEITSVCFSQHILSSTIIKFSLRRMKIITLWQPFILAALSGCCVLNNYPRCIIHHVHCFLCSYSSYVKRHWTHTHSLVCLKLTAGATDIVFEKLALHAKNNLEQASSLVVTTIKPSMSIRLIMHMVDVFYTELEGFKTVSEDLSLHLNTHYASVSNRRWE